MSVTFNGSSQYAIRASNTLLNFTSGVTIMGWVRTNSTLTSLGLTTQSILRRNTGANTTAQYTLDIALGYPNFSIGTTNCTSTTQITANTYTHIAGSHNGSTLVLYVNGVQVQTAVLSATLAVSTAAITLGASWDGTAGSNWFNGSLEDVRLFNRALTANEVQTCCTTRGASGIFHGLIANYCLDERRIGTIIPLNSSFIDTGPYALHMTVPVANTVFADGYLRTRRCY